MIRLPKLIIACLIIAVACKGSRVPPIGAETVSDDAPIPWIDDTPSIYEKINAPTLSFDSLSVYRKTRDVLKSTNSLNQSRFMSFYNSVYKITKESTLVFIDRHGAVELEDEMLSIENILLESINIVAPGSLVEDESVKNDYAVDIYLSVDEKQVLLRMCGMENKCYLRYIFVRPL